MKVHFVLSRLTPYYGLEKVTGALLRALAERGVDVSFSLVTGESPDTLSDISQRHLHARERPTRLLECVPKLRRHLLGLHSSTIIIASGLWAATSTALSLAGSSRSWFLWEHSVLTPRLQIDSRLRLLLRIIALPLLQPKHCIAVSEDVAAVLRTRFGKRDIISVIPNPVLDKEESFSVHAPRSFEEVILLSTSALKSNKNVAGAVGALKFLPNRFLLRLAGDGPERGKLEKMVFDLGLGTRVTFLGQISDVEPELRRAHVLVHPSHFETFGFSLVEAAQVGTPVVCFPVQSLPEIVPIHAPGLVASDRSQRSFADAVKMLSFKVYPGEKEFRKARTARNKVFAPSVVLSSWLDLFEYLGSS